MPDPQTAYAESDANPPPEECPVCERVRHNGNLVTGLSPIGPVWVCEDCQVNAAKLRDFKESMWSEY